MSDCPSILIIDDDPRMHKLLFRQLEPEFVLRVASSGSEGLEKVQAIQPDLILLDLMMPQISGMEVLKRLKETGREIPVIVLTAYGSVDSAVQAIKLGAADYLEKPFESQKLKQAIQALLPRRRSVQELPSRQGIIGESPQIQRVWQLVEKYGPTDLPILLEGETGTGKELFARAIHEISKRGQGPFVAVDCSALPESLVESELFGYEKGAFTGANVNKPGRLAWANGGTFLLDEISNLPPFYQAKLLRVIQEQQYTPLGAKGVKPLDVRFISTSNLNLQGAVQQGTFREDLYYRISGMVIELPPLREREGDIELLARHFMEKHGKRSHKPHLKISAEAMEPLLSHRWPGNVRELEHVLSRAVIMADRLILPQHILLGPQRSGPDSYDPGKIELRLNLVYDIRQSIDLKRVKEEAAGKVERHLIAEVKKKLPLNQTELAKFLGIDPKTLRSKERRE